MQWGPVLLAATRASGGNCTGTPVDTINSVDPSSPPTSWLTRSSDASRLEFLVTGNPCIVYVPYYELQDQEFYVYPRFPNSSLPGNGTLCAVVTEDYPAEDTAVCLRCPIPGQSITAVTAAVFGLVEGNCSSGITAGRCAADPQLVRNITEGACLGMASCQVPVNVKQFGPDPCTGVVKSLGIAVKCGASPCGIVTENWPQETNAVHVGCSPGETIVSVRQALFGNVTGNCVDGFKLGACASNTSVVERYVRTQCLHKQGCAVPANVKLFGRDPCPGVYKQLAVSVECGGKK